MKFFDNSMKNFITSDIRAVKKRIVKPTITAIIIMVALLIQETFIRHTIGRFLTKELFSSIGFCYMAGGLWYGRALVFKIGQRPVTAYDEYQEEPLEHINVTAFRVGLAVTIGARVGAVLFGIDTLRILIDKIKTFATQKA